jgi:hypothetical protein
MGNVLVSEAAMDDQTDIPALEAAPARPVRLPSWRGAAALAAAMLGVGVGVGAAIGPAPEASLAGSPLNIGKSLPLLLSALAPRQGNTTANTPRSEPAAVTPQPAPAAAAAGKTSTAASETQGASSEEPAAETHKPSAKSKTGKLPAITNVWLIELSGGTFDAALAQPAAAPYLTGQLVPAATLLGSWSALDGSAFATDTALAEPPSAGSTPPLLHSIVQPPCPEGAAGASCAPETPGQLTAADEFLKATLATITGSSLYEEHGLIVVTFATVGIATQSELPPGASTATLTYQPPAGVALLSPFAKGGLRSSATFDTTSPRRSLEKLLH